MAGKFSSLEPWVHGATFGTDGVWISDAFARDTETMTRALQISIASSSSSPEYSSSLSPTPPPSQSSLPFVTHEQPTSDSDSGSRRKTATVGVPGPSGKVSKRKSRASKRPPTTFITADPVNFRRMVQQVTGLRLGDEAIAVDTMVTKPAPLRPAVVGGGGGDGRVTIPQSCLPTLDTSAFLLGREGGPPATVVKHQEEEEEKNQQMFPVVDAGVGLFDFDTAAASFPCFPTLESWGVM